MGVKKQIQCVCVGGVLACVSAVLCIQCYQWGGGFFTFLGVATGSAALFCLILAIVAVDISHRQPADSHTLATLLSQYFTFLLFRLYGLYAYRLFMSSCKDVAASQTDTLLTKFIKPNINTEFGRKHNFENIKSREDYRRNVPLSTYDDYVHYVERIENNREDTTRGLLFSGPVGFLAVTSGSTGRNKTIPIPKNIKIQALLIKAMNFYTLCQYSSRKIMLRQLTLSYRPAVGESPSGLQKAPISFHLSRRVTHSLVPNEVYDIQNEQTALYVEAVIALAEKEVGIIMGFMSTLVWAFWQVIEQNWKQICDDIEKGTINKNIEVEPYIRAAIENNLTADPARARELRNHFSQGTDRLFKRIWPKFDCILMFATGGFSHYSNILMGGVLNGSFLISPFHGASEGLFGVHAWPNLQDPMNITYAAFTLLFQEYLPISESSEGNSSNPSQPQTLFPEQLKVGECYEVISTSPMGLYRYRMGDVIKVVDFCGQCPIYEFQYRTGHVLNVFWEKTPENVVYDALVTACSKLSLTLVDYTTTEDISMMSIPEYVPNSDCKHYILFLEAARENGSPASLTADEKSLIDQCLCERMELYQVLQKKRSIGPMHVIEVNPDTFSMMRVRLLETLNSQQVKMPRVLRDKGLLQQLLLARQKEEAG